MKKYIISLLFFISGCGVFAQDTTLIQVTKISQYPQRHQFKDSDLVIGDWDSAGFLKTRTWRGWVLNNYMDSTGSGGFIAWPDTTHIIAIKNDTNLYILTKHGAYVKYTNIGDTIGTTTGGLIGTTRLATAASTIGLIHSASVYNWLLFGNANTNPRKNFVGTDDNEGLTFRTDSIPVGRFDTNKHFDTHDTIRYAIWHGGIIGSIYGGTGINNGANTLTLASSLNFQTNAKGYAYNHGGGLITYDTTRAGGGSGLFYRITVPNKPGNVYNPNDTTLYPQYGGSGFKTNQGTKFCMSNFYNAKFKQDSGTVASQIRLLTFGDSYAGIIFNNISSQIINMCGGRYSGFCLDQTFGTPTDTGLTTNTTHFSKWVTGTTYNVTNNGAWHITVGGATFSCNKINIYYIIQPGGGTFKYEINHGGLSGSINTSGATISLGIIHIKQATTLSSIRIINNTGSKDTDEFVGVDMEDTTVNGLTYISCGIGGIALDSSTRYPLSMNNYRTFLYDIKPTVYLHMMAEDSSYSPAPGVPTYGAAIDTFYARTDTGLYHTDFILIGAPPLTSSIGNNKDRWVQNTQVQTSSQWLNAKGIYSCYYFSAFEYFGYSPLYAYYNLLQRGWQGDGTHDNSKLYQYIGNQLLVNMGFVTTYNSESPYNVLCNKITSNNIFCGTPSGGNPHVWYVMDTNSFQDVSTTLHRDWILHGRTININGGTSSTGVDISAGNQIMAGSFNTSGVVTCNYVNAPNNNSTLGSGTVVTSTGNTQLTVQRTGGSASSVALWAFGSQPYIVYSNNLDFYNNSVITAQITSTGDLKLGGSGAGNTGALYSYYSGSYNSGTIGQVLISQGTSAPQWTSPFYTTDTTWATTNVNKTIPNGYQVYVLHLVLSGIGSVGVITLPSSPIDGQVVEITSPSTLSLVLGTNFSPTPVASSSETGASGTFTQLRYFKKTTTWYVTQ